MNNNTYIHKYIKTLIHKKDNVIDMTAGNGNDTFYLSQLANKVYAFDIQKEAINRTKEKINGLNNVILINDNHINIDKYVNDEIKLVIFNLGYLPKSNSNIITNKDETLIAFIKAYNLLTRGGYLIITFYLGHHGGIDEYYLVNNYIINNKIFILEKYKENKKIFEPITFIIKKL